MSGEENYITNKPVDVMLDDAKEAELKVKQKKPLKKPWVHVTTCWYYPFIRTWREGEKFIERAFLGDREYLAKIWPFFQNYLQNAPKNILYLS